MKEMDSTIVVIGFIVLLAALLYYMYKDQQKRPHEAKPEATKEPTVVKVKDYEAQLKAEKKEEPKLEPKPEPMSEPEPEPKPEPVVSEAAAPAAEPAELGLENLSGLGEKYRALLKAAGVGSLNALAKWNPEELHRKLIDVNEGQQIVKRPPPLVTVEDWIKRAGEQAG